MKRQPTAKQWHFIQAYAETGGNATQAALQAYDTQDYNTAKVIGCENLTKPYIRQEIDKLMRKVELKAEDALRAIKDGLEADKSKTGPDHNIRLRAANTTLKLHGAFPTGKDVSHQHAHLHLEMMAMVDELSGLSIEELDELEEELRSRDRARKKLRDKQKG
ncbi:terminase small subunit [Acidobacteria bacterium AH-259-O06]|nr:terminase small subunit [Acidobacteria bacterium AH-259-O06]